MDKRELPDETEGEDVAGPVTPTPLQNDNGSLKLDFSGPSTQMGAESANGTKGEDGTSSSSKSEEGEGSSASDPSSEMITPTTAFPLQNPRFSGMSSTSAASEVTHLPIGGDGRKRVVVMGTGDFGLALAARLAQANYNVVVASRNPERTRKRVHAAGGKIMSMGEALQQSNLVILAVPFQHVSSLPLTNLANKIVVDVSNRNPKTNDPSGRSQAEHLQELIPTARVVKAFNVLSAYTLSRGIRGSKEVPVCGNNEIARNVVCSVVRDLRLDPLDLGVLYNAREVELIPLQFFPEWKFGFIVSTVIWIITFIITVFEWQLCDNLVNLHKANFTPDWSRFNTIMMNNVNITSAVTSLILLALCFLPGVMAAYLQLIRGTKYSEFPSWLDTWLKGRKHLGLLMLLTATIHVLLTLSGGLGSAYDFYEDSYAWRGPTYITCGVISFLTAALLGIASLPSVSSSLTWREFSWVQSRIGWISLLLGAGHVIFLAWDGLIQSDFSCNFLPSIGQLCIAIPLLTIVLKLPLLLPCVDSALTRIRQGYERVSVSANAVTQPDYSV